MDNNTTLWKMLVVALVERAAAALAALLVADGFLQQTDVASFDRIVTGAVVAGVVLLIGWYREKGHALVAKDLAVANQRIAAMSSKPAIVAK